MAPIRESCYFPPLDKCLDGRHQLLSWETSLVGLSKPQNTPGSSILEDHLNDFYTFEILARPFFPFLQPTTQTKSSFETKTSAINITPSAYGRYDVKELQQDAQWLSKETNIDEISALRIAVLEWQTRPANSLLESRFCKEPDGFADSIEANALKAFSHSLPSSTHIGSLVSAYGYDKSHEGIERRRQRLLCIYLSERRYILKTCELLLLSAISGNVVGKEAPRRRAWTAEIGKKLVSVWNLEGVAQNEDKNFLILAVEALRLRLDNLGKGSGWSLEEEFQWDAELAWRENQLIELIIIMQIILTLLEASTVVTRLDVVLAWFQLMRDHAFFENFEIAHIGLQEAYVSPLQSVSALVSLAMLQIQFTLDLVLQSSARPEPESPPTDEVPYIFSLTGIRELDDIFLAAADACLTIASPAVLAWSIILQTLRESALSLKGPREIRQSLRAADKYGAAESSELERSDRSFLRSNSSLQRSFSAGSDTSQQLSFLEEALEQVMDTTLDEDPIGYLAKSAVDGSHAFSVINVLATEYCTNLGSDYDGRSSLEIRKILLNLIRASSIWIEYQPTILLSTLIVLGGSDCYWDIIDLSLDHMKAGPAAIFLSDSLLMQKLYQNALARFPYETEPFLQLCRVLACNSTRDDQGHLVVWSLLQNLDSLTCVLPVGFMGYEIIREDEDANYIQLTEDLEVIENFSGASPESKSRAPLSSRALVVTSIAHGFPQLPIGTIGRVLSESKPLVVMWRFDYSLLAYMGKILQEATTKGYSSTENSSFFVPREVVSQIIDIITFMLSASTRHPPTTQENSPIQEEALIILENASDYLERNQDIISIILQIFENELHISGSAIESAGSFDILNCCVQFIHALLPVVPDRVWSFLGRSSFLEIDGLESRISAIITSNEMMRGYHSFLVTCIRLYDRLIDDTIARAVSSRSPPKNFTRFTDMRNQTLKVSATMIEKVLFSFQRTMMDVFESIIYWKSASSNEKSEVNAQICLVFTKLLDYYYRTDDQLDSRQKLARPLSSAANYLLEAFLLSSSSSLTVHPLLQLLLEGLIFEDNPLSNRSLKARTRQVTSTLRLITTLAQVCKYLGRSATILIEHMFNAAPIIASLYTVHESYRFPVVELLNALILNISETLRQPPSLLSHLGENTTCHFLEVLSLGDQPFNDVDLSVAIWDFFSTVISRRQQWLAILLLTGNSPKKTLKTDEKKSLSSQRIESFLEIALDKLSQAENLEWRAVVVTLEFVINAANYLPWVLTPLEEHPRFLLALVEFLALLSPKVKTTNDEPRTLLPDFVKTQIISFIMDIFAMFIHNNPTAVNQSHIKKIRSHISFLAERVVSPPSYNASLHSNLRRNFESRYPTCELVQFKRTHLTKPRLGTSFYYDLEIANKMLMFDSAWAGKRGRGFADEVARANINLSVVESQVNLFHSWRFLVVEFTQVLSAEASFQDIMVSTVEGCLASNATSALPEAVFVRLARSRADLAFTLLERLIELHSSDQKLRNALFTAWETVRTYETDVGLALAREGSEYYRVLLKILCLTLQVHTWTLVPPSSTTVNENSIGTNEVANSLFLSKITHTVLEIFSVIVARGFRSLTSLLHDDASQISPEDFYLIITIARTSLHVPSVMKQTTQLQSVFADSETPRCISALLSWSDQISVDHDLIYGELSLLFLRELSNIPTLAETLALEGILTQVSSANIISNIRHQKGLGPFDHPTRLYNMWSQGVLPLLLNLLHAVGGPIATEIASSLNNFPGQLKRASSTFAVKPISSRDSVIGSITLGMVSEAQNLAALVSILETFREAGPSAGIIVSQTPEPNWDKTQVKEDIEGWMQKRAGLRLRIRPTNEREEALLRQPPLSNASNAENRLEEKIVQEMYTVLGILDGAE